MDQTKKTVMFAGVAVVLALLAWLAAPSRITPEAFVDQGSQFFPEFTDPNEAMSLEIVRYNSETGAAQPFKVHFRNGRWTIPSHHDYPADARDQLATTAAAIIEMARDDFRTDNPADFEALGVIDPLDETSPAIEGRGTRVTVRGRNDVVLADLIVGNEVPGRQGMRFVRLPDHKRVFAVQTDVNLTARFSDWIKTDLLEVTKSKIDRVTIEDYSINERTRRVEERDRIRLTKADDGEWGINRLGSGMTVDTTAVEKLLTTLDSLAIVGVRPKPEGVTKSLTQGAQISQSDLLSLQSKGFFVTQEGQLLSNEGELQVHTTDGVIYTLRFGEILYGGGLALTAGTEGDESDAEQQESRYLFVTAQFDEGMFPEPPAPSDYSFRDKPDSLLTETDRTNRELAREHDRWQRQVERGRELTERLNNRFGDWYYVISADSFEKLRLERQDLVMAKS
ncbi:DUF4340 domain-containing protein [candidate division GN15 bacterium]|nr:DUF4340 domain-containing protein [candidate division GN15 bacterium]